MPVELVSLDSFHGSEKCPVKIALDNKLALNLDLDLRALPSNVDRGSAQRLLQYFDHIIAPVSNALLFETMLETCSNTSPDPLGTVHALV